MFWRGTMGQEKIFIVECKRLVEAVTVAEAVQRLEEFKGDPTEMDQLAKHERRVKWLQQKSKVRRVHYGHPSQSRRVPSTPGYKGPGADAILEEVFPADQFVDFEMLGERLAGCGFPASSGAKA